MKHSDRSAAERRDNRKSTRIHIPMPIMLPPSLILLVLTSVALSAVAQMMLKIGSAQTNVSGLTNQLGAYATSPHVLGGFALYGTGAILWIFVLAKLPLSVAYPFVGIGFILTMVLGGLVLGETLSPLRISGTLFVVLGCTLVAISSGEII